MRFAPAAIMVSTPLLIASAQLDAELPFLQPKPTSASAEQNKIAFMLRTLPSTRGFGALQHANPRPRDRR